MKNSLLSLLFELVYPTRCVSCGNRGSLFCESCEGKLNPLSHLDCVVCGRPALGGFTHPPCMSRFTPERFLSAFSYRGPARSLIKALKYRGLRRISDVMARLLFEDLEEKGIAFGRKAIVVPIPLSFWRQNERGFNQAGLLARSLAKALKLKLREDLLEKVRNSPSQVSLSKRERTTNLQGVFQAPKRLRKKDVLLVDDVLTTGVTVREATRVLKKAGADQVWVLTFARD